MKAAEIIRFPLFSGANDVTRTHDLLITNQLLYRLSYISIFTFEIADLILTNQLLYRLSYISIFIFGAANLILTNQLLYQLSYTSILTWKRTAPASVNSPAAMLLHFQRR